MQNIKSLHISISGLVQGVGYRAWMARTASAAGLSGWVRNRYSGEVEAVICGPANAIDLMIDAAKMGPKGARVDELLILSEATQLDGDFRILDSC
ncbi:acylphosphatase [Rhizobiales bacterium]|uniref:acylphosphatase n=1 Tax=Hongsoonwoonella zoysiae TaxID=2821844 RepID=UPI001560EE52|nr:acylphosphatase [Hongsoonwoonella zoysiae]NRG19218.1 acylphosphatase [Hongsoonwoonella zoysiae]